MALVDVHRCEPRQTQTKREWDVMGDGDGRNRPQMTTTPITAQVATSRSTERLLRESATCRRTDQISSSRQRRFVVRWQNHQCVTWKVSRGSEDTSLETESKVLAGSADGTEVSCGSALGRQMGRRQSLSTIGISWSYHERPRSSRWCSCPLLRVNKPRQRDWGPRAWRRTWGEHED